MQRPEVVIDPVEIDHHAASVGIDYFGLTGRHLRFSKLSIICFGYSPFSLRPVLLSAE